MMKTKKALIVIDMLRDFMEKKGALYCGDEARKIIPFVKKTIDRFRKEQDIIVYAKDSHRPNDKEFKIFAKHCVSGSAGSQIVREIRPTKNDWIIPKTTYDAAFESGLVKILKEHFVKDIFLVGVSTSICVMETASSLAKLGFRINILKRGVADFDGKAHSFALKRMKFVYGANVI